MPRSNITLEMWCKRNNCEDLLGHLVNINDKYVSYSTHNKIDWVCDLGHHFSIDPGKFTNRSRCTTVGVFKCPYCSGQKVLVGFNDLKTTNPELASEWDYSRNKISIESVTKGSHKDAWWKCKNNHSWCARISARDYGNGCPYCSDVLKTSMPEQILYYYILKYFKDALNMYSIDGVSFDIYIPSKNVCIEYDGSFWHSIKDTDYKFEYAKSRGIELYKITGLEARNSNSFSFDDNGLKLVKFPNGLTKVLQIFLKEVFNIVESFEDYIDAYRYAKSRVSANKNKKESIILPTNIEFEWSPLNGYEFEYVTNDSQDKIWRCFKGHTFSRRLDVVRRGSIACPYCHNKRSFTLFYLGSINNNHIILDTRHMDLEFVSSSDIINALDVGINIRGVIYCNGNLELSNRYLEQMPQSTFRINFACLYGKTVNNYSDKFINVSNCISSIFTESSSFEKVHYNLVCFLSKSIGIH